MRQAWRWYGPDDPVTLDHVRQAGAHEIVTALHQYAPGEVWPREAVAERKALIENTPPAACRCTWTVVESIPVPDDILREGGARALDRGLDRKHAGGRRRGHPHHLLQRDAGGRLDPHRSRFSVGDRRDRAALRPRPLRGVRPVRAQARGRRRRLRRGHAGARAQGASTRWREGEIETADAQHLGRAARRDDVFANLDAFARAHRVLSRHHAGQDARQCRGVPRTRRRRSPTSSACG